MSTNENQEAEPQDVSKFQAFVRSAARAPGMRPGRTWLATTTARTPGDLPAHTVRIAPLPRGGVSAP